MSQGNKTPRRALLGLFVLVLVLGCFILLTRADHTSTTQDSTPLAGEVTLSDAMADGQAGSDEVAADAQAEGAAGEAADEGPAPYVIDDQGEPAYVEGSDAVADAGQVEEARLTIPEGVDYEPDVVLFSVAEGATVEEVNAALAQTGSVAPREVTAEEVAYGLIKLEVAEGASVEDAMNDLDVLDVSDGAQPNFIYYALLGDESDLRQELSDSLLPQAEDPVGESETSTATSDDGEESASDGAEDATSSTADEGPATSDGTSSYDSASDSSGTEEETPSGSLEAQDDETEVDDQDEDDPQEIEDALETTDDPSLSAQWALASMHVYEAWALAKCDHQVGVAIIDWGPQATHEDIAENVVDVYDAYGESDTLPFSANHGTVVAGITSAVANNGTGIAGVSYNADLMLINVMHSSSDNTTGTSELVRAYRHVIDNKDAHNIRVINISIGGSRSTSVDTIVDDKLKAVIDEAYDAGIITVAAAGNSNVKAVPYYEYPGDFSNIVSVMNLKQVTAESEADSGVERNDTSNYNVDGQTAKNISAPGTNIVSTYANNRYSNSLNGTSMASPQVTGVLALEFAATPNLSADDAVYYLYSSAYSAAKETGGIYKEDASFDANYMNYGWGEVNAFRAVKLAKGLESAEELPDISHLDVPTPIITGATQVPVGATTEYTVTNGSIAIKSGGEYASLEGTTLTGLKAGTVVLSVLNKNGEERSTHTVTVYDTSGTWIITSQLDTSYVIDISRGSVYDGGNAILYKQNGKNNQVWLLEAQDDGTFLIRGGKSGKLLDVADSSEASGANVCQNASTRAASRSWRIEVAADNSLIFTNKNSGMALEVNSDSAQNSKNIRQATRTASNRQRWNLKSVKADIGVVWDGIYRVSSRINQSFVLDVHGESMVRSANVEIFRWKGGDNQRWQFTYLGNDVYKITNVNSGLTLDVSGGKLGSSKNIIQWSWKNASNQRWNLKGYSDGSFAIMAAGTTWAIDVYYGKAVNCRNVQLFKQKDNSGQRWFLQQF